MLGLKIGASRSRAFDPSALFAGGTAGIWIDPADLSTMFQDAGGTVPAAVDAPVGLIRDKSGRGNHASQPAAASRPILRRDAAGRHALHFDGVDDFLHHGFAATGDATLSCAAQRTAGVEEVGLFLATPPNARLQLGIWAQTAPPHWGTYAAGAYRSSGRDAALRVVMSVVARAGPDAQQLYTDGARGPELIGSYGGDARDRRAIGREFNALDRGPFAGALYALIGVGRALGEAELAMLVRHQAGQAGVRL